jgi:hypothetical protein
MMALKIAKEKNTITDERYTQLLFELEAVPEKVDALLKNAEILK